VNLKKQQVQTVSPTLGQESLHQGIIAGVVGLILLALYLLFYYRMLGIVAWFGMSIWAVLAIGLVAVAGRTLGYSLTLAGVAGLVISLGITADSYIVFFERLKDEVRHGKTPRAAVQPAFKRAYKTIVAADIVTALAALILYITARLRSHPGRGHPPGPVRRVLLQAPGGVPDRQERAPGEPARLRPDQRGGGGAGAR
jgi:preprotein translocase subunit SecD